MNLFYILRYPGLGSIDVKISRNYDAVQPSGFRKNFAYFIAGIAIIKKNAGKSTLLNRIRAGCGWVIRCAVRAD
jgi:hypothetical protein